MNAKSIIIAIVLIVSSSAQTFEAFRLKSGMTSDQVKHAVPTYELRWTGSDRFGWQSAILVNSEDDIYATLTFCNNGLVGLNRNIDPDIDFIRYLQDRLKEF